jgi:hypothetical protein
LQRYILIDPTDRATFQAYWREHVQSQTLIDILGLPFAPTLPLSLYSVLILRTAETDMSFVVDTAGARVKVGTVAVEHGDEEQARYYFSPDQGEPTSIEDIRRLGPEHFNLAQKDWQTLIQVPNKFWERIEPDMVGQQVGDIEFFDTTMGGYTYCHKIVIAFERHRLILEDSQDEMRVEVSPQFYTTG